MRFEENSLAPKSDAVLAPNTPTTKVYRKPVVESQEAEKQKCTTLVSEPAPSNTRLQEPTRKLTWEKWIESPREEKFLKVGVGLGEFIQNMSTLE